MNTWHKRSKEIILLDNVETARLRLCIPPGLNHKLTFLHLHRQVLLLLLIQNLLCHLDKVCADTILPSVFVPIVATVFCLPSNSYLSCNSSFQRVFCMGSHKDICRHQTDICSHQTCRFECFDSFRLKPVFFHFAETFTNGHLSEIAQNRRAMFSDIF